jgi:hypothetical protein
LFAYVDRFALTYLLVWWVRFFFDVYNFRVYDVRTAFGLNVFNVCSDALLRPQSLRAVLGLFQRIPQSCLYFGVRQSGTS